jgi:1-deoxy-D-xylulose-5-phosphate synthase
MTALAIGKAEIKRQGRRVALLAFGSLVPLAQEVGDKLDATVVNMRFIKPLDEALVLDLAQTHDLLVTLDENTIQGGAGGAVTEALAANGMACHVLHLGLPDSFLQHGARDDMLREAGLSVEQIDAAVRRHLERASGERSLKSVG